MPGTAIGMIDRRATDKREFSRAQARRNRAAARAQAAQTERDTAEIMREALTQARRILTDKGFVQLLYDSGVQSIPRTLAPGTLPRASRGNQIDRGPLDGSLDFIIAWTFLFPLFKRPDIATYLETAWPGFTLQMKDAFITVVVEGPFPHAISGFQGRRRGAVNRTAGQRPIASKQQSV